MTMTRPPFLAKKGAYATHAWTADCYHAGLSAAQRKRVRNVFMSGRLRVVLATVAFGMGLDKADVRAFIHYNMPKIFESYVQEIGRAGRDREEAHCHVFLDHEGNDINELKRHIYGNTVDAVTIKKLVCKIFPPCKCKFLHEAVDKTNQKTEEFEDDGIDYNQINETQSAEDCSNTENTELEISPPGGSLKATHQIGTRGPTSRLCPGHERAVPINQTVTELDMKEEGISTLLCYLELHDKHYVENLQPVYSNCVIQCYGGPKQLQALASKI